MNNSRTTILYLGTRALSLEKIEEIAAAQRLGYDVIMASDFPENFLSYGFKHNFKAPLGNHAAALPLILDYLKENALSVSGIISWQDQEEELAGHLTKALNLATCSLSANKNARDKTATRETLKALGGKYNPNYQLVTDQASFDASLEKIGIPCILKLAGNSGGRGVLAIHSKEDAQATWEKFLNDTAVDQGGLYTQYRDAILLEEWVIGSEHSISGIVTEDDICLLAITDKRLDHSVQLQYENVLPSTLSLTVQDDIKTMAREVIAASGIKWRGFHIDFIVTDKGIKVLEIGARLGGECINSHLIPMASSGRINPYELVLKYVIQGQPLPLSSNDYTQSFDKRVGSRVIAPPSPGWITHIQGFDLICEHQNTRDFVQLKGIGSKMRPPTDAYEEYKVAYVLAECPLKENLSEIFDEMLTNVDISVTSTQP